MNRLYLAVAIAAVALPAYAQTSAKNASKGADAATQQFVEKAAIGDMYEIQSSKLAQSKSQNADVKEFAEHIVTDHTKSSEELKSLVKDMQGMEVPGKMDAKHQKMVDQLQSASGAQFDQQYKKQQIEAHQTAVQLFTGYSKSGTNDEIKSFAEKTLPTLKKHLEMAQDLPEGSAKVGQAQPMPSQKNQAASDTQNRQRSAQSGTQSRQTDRDSKQSQAKVISTPGPNHILASDLEGTNVYGANNESIGEISEVVLNREGQVVAIVVGVGGFLGIGQKNVAIPFDAIEISEQSGDGQSSASNNRGAQKTMQPQRIVLRGMTKQELEAAPAFDNDSDDSANKQDSRTPQNQNQDRNKTQNR